MNCGMPVSCDTSRKERAHKEDGTTIARAELFVGKPPSSELAADPDAELARRAVAVDGQAPAQTIDEPSQQHALVGEVVTEYECFESAARDDADEQTCSSSNPSS
jgi:hypothetical protein